jgi:hypothetical protein
MPRRLRISKRRDQLTLSRDLILGIGPIPGPRSPRPCPEPGSSEWELLRELFEQHRYYSDGEERYGPGTWGYLAFELGDIAAALRVGALIPVDD